MTIATPLELRTLIGELSLATWTLSAIGTLLESGLVEHLREARSLEDLSARCPALPSGTIERCLGVALAAGVVSADGQKFCLAPGALPFSEAPGRNALRGELRSQLMQALALLDAAASGNATSGWTHTNPSLLQAQGDSSMAMVPLFKANVVPGLGDLSARLDRAGARFLDVGVGVASLAIAMCRAWPALHVVGLDVLEQALALARQNVARAQLAERISLRQLAVEHLQDLESFDLAWLPSFFVAREVLPAAIVRVRAALRPGAWLILPVSGLPGSDLPGSDLPGSDLPERAELPRAVFALISQLWGGPALSSAEGEMLLKEAGFSNVRVLPGPPSTPPLLVAQR